MAYVAVTGGREAIEQSLKLLEIFRESGEDITISCIKENMGLLIDKIMSEAGFYSRDYAALALKQCEGSVEEAVFRRKYLPTERGIKDFKEDCFVNVELDLKV